MSTYQERQERIRQFREGRVAETPEVEQQDTEGMTLIETLSTDTNYKTIKDYMSDRFGMEEDKYSQREIIPN